MPGRSRREERRRKLEEEGVARRIREQAESERGSFFLERDPIKQFVRRFGWLQIIRDYVERRRNDGVDRPIRYLTLPGPAATDVGMLWRAGLLERNDAGFPNLVICDEEHADEALVVVGTVAGVSKRSFRSAIQKDLIPYFPLDVINLDMYGAVLTGSSDRRKALATIVALRRTFDLQRGQSFLLLLTCSTDDHSAHTYLEECLSGNFGEDDFREAFFEQYQRLDSSPFQTDYRAFVGLVLPKVVGRMARERGYGIIEHFAAKYDRGANRILCHSFELEPLGRKKPEKRYETRFKNIEQDELSDELSISVRGLANEAYRKFIPTLVPRDLLDVEAVLRADPEIEARMRQEAESLIGWEKQNGP